jgi:hypothetical protein
MICPPQLFILFLQLCDLIKQVLQCDLVLLLGLRPLPLQLRGLFLCGLVQPVQLSDLDVGLLLELLEGLSLLHESPAVTTRIVALFFSLVGVLIHLSLSGCEDREHILCSEFVHAGQTTEKDLMLKYQRSKLWILL